MNLLRTGCLRSKCFFFLFASERKKQHEPKRARTKKWLLVENCNISTKIQFFCTWELKLDKSQQCDWNVIVNICSVPENESLTYRVSEVKVFFFYLPLRERNSMNQKGHKPKSGYLWKIAIFQPKYNSFFTWESRLNKWQQFDWNVIVNICSVPEKESFT